jgi:nucleotide-binding universal stress UspA family protein
MPLIEERVSVSVKKILLATDFSSVSEKAAAYARALARRFSSTVEIAHVFDPSDVTSYEEAIVGLPVNERRRTANEDLERLRDDLSASGINARTTLAEGHRPFATLLKIAKDHEVDLIVAGTESKSGVERLILGSTAEGVIRNAECLPWVPMPGSLVTLLWYSKRLSMRPISRLRPRRPQFSLFRSPKTAAPTFFSVMCLAFRPIPPRRESFRIGRSNLL